MALFKITVSGFETVQKDLEKEQKGIEFASGFGLRMVESEMYNRLAKHIHDDWYEPWGPPEVYKRRTDNHTLGTPLGDLAKNVLSDVKGNTLSFEYIPTGKHANPDWYTHDGDEIIEIIQTNMKWTWQPNNCFPRPFWNNFVNEQFNGAAFDAFDYGFSGRGYDLISEGVGKDLEYTGGESLLEAAEDYYLPL